MGRLSELTTMVQQPSTLWVPERLGSYGPEIVDFATEYGMEPDPTQARDIDALASYGEFGSWVALETAHIEGRQNGKTKRVLLPITLADFVLFDFEPDLIFWSSHRMDTTLDVFRFCIELFTNYDWLRQKVDKIDESKTRESITLLSGSVMQFIARSEATGRGKGAKRLVYDEAMFLSAEMMGATIPTLSARHNPQIMYASSAGVKRSSQLRALERRGRRMDDPSLIFIEYKAPGSWGKPTCREGKKCSHMYGVKGCSFDNPENWRQGNHSMMYGRITEAFVAAERRSLCQTPEGVLEFGRERMGWTEGADSITDPDSIQEADWESTVDPESKIVGPKAFSVYMNPEGKFVSIGVAGLREDGHIHFGVVDYLRVGKDDVLGRLNKLTNDHDTMCPVVWQKSGPIGAYRTVFDDADFDLVDMNTDEFAAACGFFKKAIETRTAFHRASGKLDDAFLNHERRVRIDGSWTIEKRTTGPDVGPLIAAVQCAYMVSKHGGREPGVFVF